jgi:hypothetical protein
MSNSNLHRAQHKIDCFNKNHPNVGGCCCSGRQIPGPTGPTALGWKWHILFYLNRKGALNSYFCSL